MSAPISMVTARLARLALRASDARDLRLKDIDWSQGSLRVVGKGRCETRLPLPQDASDAILHYLEHFRPTIDDDHVFLKVHAPFGPLFSRPPPVARPLPEREIDQLNFS
jgi:integrase/recombinase XerD